MSELSSKDYGQGIKNPQKILERYYREDSYKSGFGIGMCIVKSIMDEADIELQIDSVLGEGSRFSYTFGKSMIIKKTNQESESYSQSSE
ncbi:MAG: hypothetical protein Q9M40_07580 [Sulfurimonas sp.]|nr:hypothetical protein [Sulfurimonas sp.]